MLENDEELDQQQDEDENEESTENDEEEDEEENDLAEAGKIQSRTFSITLESKETFL